MCLNGFVIFRMCDEEKVKVAHFVLFSVFLVGVALLFCVVFVVSAFVVGLLGSCLMWLCGVWFPFPELAGAVEGES